MPDFTILRSPRGDFSVLRPGWHAVRHEGSRPEYEIESPDSTQRWQAPPVFAVARVNVAQVHRCG